MSELLPCPFCGQHLRVSKNRINPSAKCVTEDCQGGRMSVVNLDSPEMIAAWNTRPAPVTDVRREEVARIIDRLAFKVLDNSYRVPSDSEFKQMKAARETADAILALLSGTGNGRE